MLGGMGLGYSAARATRESVTMAGTAARASAKATSATAKFVQLEERVEKLLLVNMAMWELIQECTNLTEEDLACKVKEIDLRDGVADGKKTNVVKLCPKCNRTMSPKHSRCLYCGAEDLAAGTFDGI